MSKLACTGACKYPGGKLARAPSKWENSLHILYTNAEKRSSETALKNFQVCKAHSLIQLQEFWIKGAFLFDFLVFSGGLNGIPWGLAQVSTLCLFRCACTGTLYLEASKIVFARVGLY